MHECSQHSQIILMVRFAAETLPPPRCLRRGSSTQPILFSSFTLGRPQQINSSYRVLRSERYQPTIVSNLHACQPPPYFLPTPARTFSSRVVVISATIGFTSPSFFQAYLTGALCFARLQQLRQPRTAHLHPYLLQCGHPHTVARTTLPWSVPRSRPAPQDNVHESEHSPRASVDQFLATPHAERRSPT